jgi:hypothetical protein
MHGSLGGVCGTIHDCKAYRAQAQASNPKMAKSEKKKRYAR